jgi:hypothetical protein
VRLLKCELFYELYLRRNGRDTTKSYCQKMGGEKHLCELERKKRSSGKN